MPDPISPAASTPPIRATSAVGRLRQRASPLDRSPTSRRPLIAVVVAWVVIALFALSSSGHHDEIGGAGAAIGFLLLSVVAVVTCMVAGIAAAVRLTRQPGDNAARVAVALAGVMVVLIGAWVVKAVL